MGKSQKTARRELIEKMQREQARRDKRRTIMIVTASIVVALGIIAYPAVKLIQDARLKNAQMADIGAKASAAACGEVVTDAAEQYTEHETQEGIVIPYKHSPPTSGRHYVTPAAFEKKFYDKGDRPPISTLVHNLEHGYTILWYNDTIAADKKQLDQLERMAKGKFPAEAEGKFIAAPFHASEGAAWPAGKNVAFAHWGGPSDTSSEEKAKTTQQSHLQYCGSVSGQALSEFIKKFPAGDAPEPGAA